ncbi:MAG: DUF4962 domain-containing protein [candidate division WOR-3 bacterium]
MLRVILCITIAITATSAWEVLNSVPEPGRVVDGAAITYGGDRVWGVFPNPDSEITYLLYYNPNDNQWHLPSEPEVAFEMLKHTGITYDWKYDDIVFIIGEEDGEPMLYWYIPSTEEWDYDDIVDFSLDDGASIAYRPNPYHCMLYPIPGWLYCLPGGDREFWRYWIPSPWGPVAVDGIYPGQGATIADQTPVFIWEEVPYAVEYRLVVATDPNFFTTIIDVTTATPEYQVETEMENGTYYWKTASRSSSSTWNWSEVHTFTLQGGWEQLDSIPEYINEGAALAYEPNYYGTECLVAFIGSSTHCYRYDLNPAGSWVRIHDSRTQNPGSALATRVLKPPYPTSRWGIFGGYDSLYEHAPPIGWTAYGDEEAVLPKLLGPGASLAYFPGDDSNYLYLIVGEDDEDNARNDFYRLRIPLFLDDSGDGDGGQTAYIQSIPQQTRIINSNRSITIEYSLDTPANVRISVYDAIGRLIKALHAGHQRAGAHQLHWEAQTSGACFVLLDIGDKQVRLKTVVR